MSAAVAVTVEAVARTSPQAAFDVIVPIDLPTIFRASRLLPGVAGVRDQSGPWDHAGATRTVMLTDGSQIAERLTAVERPSGFTYRLDQITGRLRLLVSHADGEWQFMPGPDGDTLVRWTYAFTPRAGRRALVRLVLAPLWRGYAQRALNLAVDAAQQPG